MNTSTLEVSSFAPTELGSTTLIIGPEARWFATPGSGRTSLSTRAVLRRVLLALVEAHASGMPFDLDRLVGAGWPGEIVSRCSARNRLAVALSTLRSMGLRSCLIRAPGGWLLDPMWNVIKLSGV